MISATISHSRRTSGRHLLSSPSIVTAALGVCISINFQVLLPVVPVLSERSGPHGAAGAATAALFVGAVFGELVTPWLMSRRDATSVLVGGLLLTAVPSLVYVVPLLSGWQLIAAAGVRGLGMGVAIVVSVALVAELARPDRRGRSIGLFGLALTAPSVIFPSIGLSLLEVGHAELAAVVAFVSGLAGTLVALKLPQREVVGVGLSINLVETLRRPGLAFLFLGFALVSSSFGGIVTYAPVALPPNGIGSAAAFLLIAGVARTASRWLSGLVGDHRQAWEVLVGGAVLCLGGLMLLAVHQGSLLVLVAAAVYGTGHGAVQTGGYLAMAERATGSRWSAISALWNSAIDLGASLGGALVGLSAAHYGYATAVWVMPIVVLISLPLLCWALRPMPAFDVEGEGEARAQRDAQRNVT